MSARCYSGDEEQADAIWVPAEEESVVVLVCTQHGATAVASGVGHVTSLAALRERD